VSELAMSVAEKRLDCGRKTFCFVEALSRQLAFCR
jgi:hypothetical protein